MNDTTITLVFAYLMALLGMAWMLNDAWKNRGEKVKRKFLIMHRINVLNRGKG